MSDAWLKVPLAEVLRHRKQFITIDDLTAYKRCRVQLHAEGIVLRDQVPGSQINTKTQQVCRAGEFLVAEIDAKLGGFGIVPPELDGAIVSSHYFLFEIVEERLDRRFLGWYCKTPAFREQVRAQGTTNYAAIRPAHVLAYTIPLPPLAEQRRIVARLDALAAKIEEAKGLRHQAEKSGKALVASLVSDKIRAFPAKCWVPISEIAAIRGGGTPSKIDPTYWEGPVPWVSPKDMKRRRIADAEDHVSIRATEETSARVLPVGSVLVVIRGMILAHTVPAAVLDVPAAVNQDMKALIPHAAIDSTYLCEALWALNSDLLDSVDRSTHDTRKLLTEKLLAFRVPVPDLSVQREFVRWSASTSERALRASLAAGGMARRLDALLPSCLDRAFAGAL
jgi:type I restriction enzyme S subunit